MASADRLGRPSLAGSDDTGVVPLLRRTVRTLRDVPEVVVLYLFAAPFAAVGGVGNVLASFAWIVAVGLLVSGLDVDTSGSNSTGVRFLLAFVSALVAGIAILVGLLLIVLPGLYAMVRFYLVIPAVVIDDYGPIEALRTSWRRTEGRVLEIGGVVFCIYLVTFVVAAVVLLGTAGGIEPAIERIGDGETFLSETAAALVNGPLVAASSTLIYLQSRE